MTPPSDRAPRSAGAETAPEVLPISMLPQPDDASCGPTCLHAVLRYWGEDVTLDDVAASARSLGTGQGTLAVMLGVDALRRGYRAVLYSFNLHVLDPSWFENGRSLPNDELIKKLEQQADAKSARDRRFRPASDAYVEFLRRGGAIRFRDPTSRLISAFIRDGKPVLTGLSATYLYQCPREFGPDDEYDDVRGEPAGHFVVLHGYDPRTRLVSVADPLEGNPGFPSRNYTVKMSRLVPSIMLGVLTYDANLLVIEPAPATRRQGARG